MKKVLKEGFLMFIAFLAMLILILGIPVIFPIMENMLDGHIASAFLGIFILTIPVAALCIVYQKLYKRWKFK